MTAQNKRLQEQLLKTVTPRLRKVKKEESIYNQTLHKAKKRHTMSATLKLLRKSIEEQEKQIKLIKQLKQ